MYAVLCDGLLPEDNIILKTSMDIDAMNWIDGYLLIIAQVYTETFLVTLEASDMVL